MFDDHKSVPGFVPAPQLSLCFLHATLLRLWADCFDQLHSLACVLFDLQSCFTISHQCWVDVGSLPSRFDCHERTRVCLAHGFGTVIILTCSTVVMLYVASAFVPTTVWLSCSLSCTRLRYCHHFDMQYCCRAFRGACACSDNSLMLFVLRTASVLSLF